VQFVIDGVNTGSPIQLVAGKATGVAIATLTPCARDLRALQRRPGFGRQRFSALTQTVGQVNDKFAHRTVLSGTSITANRQQTSAQTKETGEPNHAGNAGGKSLWYTWTAPSSGKLTIDTAAAPSTRFWLFTPQQPLRADRGNRRRKQRRPRRWATLTSKQLSA